MTDYKYYNFPVKMMQGVLEGWKDKIEFLQDVLYFHIYNHSQKMEDLNEYEESDAERFKRSASYWNVEMSGEINSRLKRGKKLIKDYADNKVFVGIGTEVFWNFYKSEKTDFEWECLVTFLGLKSILGHKSYCKSNNALLYARMSGNEKVTDDHVVNITEYHRNKIITQLEIDWNLKYYSRYTRGFYFGIDITLKDLIFNAEAKRDNLKKLELKNSKAEILKSWAKSKT